MRQPTYPLRPIIPSNACTPRITAAAGTKLAGASFGGTVNSWGYSPQAFSSRPTELYNPKAFFTHAAWLRQTFVHCARFPTAASRRSLDRVSVPVWLIVLSDQLPVVALVGRYPQRADGPRAHPEVIACMQRPPFPSAPEGAVGLSGISLPFGRLSRAS